MSKIRTLVVDDSVVVRRLISTALANDSSLEVVGSASNGQIALAKIEILSPDILVIDFEMPVMNGLEMLKALRKKNNKLPIVMFSSATERGAQITMEALSLGASDYLLKPTTGNINQAIEYIQHHLAPKLKALCLNKLEHQIKRKLKLSSTGLQPSLCLVKNIRIDIVVIGASTGGPKALAKIISNIPSHFPIPILIVQHMPPFFTKSLANNLNEKSPLNIREAFHQACVQAGEVWIAPGDFHMEIGGNQGKLQLVINQNPPVHSCRPSVDVLFQSAARKFGENTLGIVLTGMGSDGLQGAELIREMGGRILCQDKESSVIWGMPGAVVKAGLAEKILPLEGISNELAQLAKQVKLVSRHS